MKQFISGMVVMALIASVAFNFYQSGKLSACVVVPAAIEKIDLK